MEWILNWIKSIFQSIMWFFENFIYLMQQIWNWFLDIGSFIISILWFLYYSWKTLINWLWRLIFNVFDWWVFVNVNSAFMDISNYIGGPATVFLASLLLIAIIRVLIAFIFKLMRLNIDYNTMDKNTRSANRWSNLSEHGKRIRTK